MGKLFAEIKTIPPILQNAYLPSLDGLRGIAIIMVVLSHMNFTDRFGYGVIFNGKLGVLIFFVISGFLITTLCIKEKVISGNISLKNFYIRRTLRIFPVAYLFILVIIGLNLVYKLNISYINILGTALYLMNFTSYFRKNHFTWFTGHFWSLSVEEQFYLALPFILKKKFKLYLSAILFIIFVLPLVIALEYNFTGLHITFIYALAHYLIKFQSIAVGCLCSIFVFKYALNNLIFSRLKFVLNLLAVIAIFVIDYDNFFNLGNVLWGLLISFLIGYIIISNIAQANDLIFKLLNAKFLKIVGVLSYSLYVWQQIFTSYDKRLPFFMVTSPYNFVALIIVSCISYYFYERFFLNLKTKFIKIKGAAI